MPSRSAGAARVVRAAHSRGKSGLAAGSDNTPALGVAPKSGKTKPARFRPKVWEPSGEKWRPSASQSSARALSTSSPGSTTQPTRPGADPPSRRRASITPWRTGSRAEALEGTGGGANATLATPRSWQAAWSWRRLSPMAAAARPEPMSLVPAIMTARSKGPCSSSIRASPLPRNPMMSTSSSLPRPSAISSARIPLSPQARTSQRVPLVAPKTPMRSARARA
mmetsp:Transcript_36647/g.105463  ORF Transcript_36647/g.105463 Transcript_36647/m.105463 type:complete len:223 (+) Transcript_36647:354-1022(+)